MPRTLHDSAYDHKRAWPGSIGERGRRGVVLMQVINIEFGGGEPDETLWQAIASRLLKRCLGISTSNGTFHFPALKLTCSNGSAATKPVQPV